MNCEEARAMLELILDGEAPGGKPGELEAHLAGCEACRRYKAELYALDKILDSYETPKISKDLASRVSSRARAFSSVLPMRRWALAYALAACLLIVIAFGGLLDNRPPKETGSSPAPVLVAAREVPDQEIIKDLDLYENAELLENFELCADLDVLEDLEESH
jgi:predicted anti-sigma-YlaC factor YlaD